MRPNSETFEHDLPHGLAAFDQGMRAGQVFGIDAAEDGVGGRFDAAGVDQVSHTPQQNALLVHVNRLEHRAREHQLPVQRQRLVLEGVWIQSVHVVDDGQRPAASGFR